MLSVRAELDRLDHSLAQARQAEVAQRNSSSSFPSSSSSTFNSGSAVESRYSDHRSSSTSSNSSTSAETGASSSGYAPQLLPELLQQRRVAAAHLRTAQASRAHANKGVEAERRVVRAKVLRSATVYAGCAEEWIECIL